MKKSKPSRERRPRPRRKPPPDSATFLRILFIGTSEFAVPALRALHARHEIVAVVTQPDRPAGRGHKLTPTPVKASALELGLRVLEPPSGPAIMQSMTRDDISSIDFIVLASYGKILPAALLQVPKLAALNIHPSLLPKYRGATPIQSALRNGEQQTGVSIMQMDAGMDTGPLLLQEPAAIHDGDDYGTLHDRLAQLGAAWLLRAIDGVAQGTLHPRPQSGEASITKPIRKEDLQIDWSLPPREIVNMVRAYAPQPAARAQYLGVPVKLLQAHVENGALVVDRLIAPNHAPESGAAFRSRMQKATR